MIVYKKTNKSIVLQTLEYANSTQFQKRVRKQYAISKCEYANSMHVKSQLTNNGRKTTTYID